MIGDVTSNMTGGKGAIRSDRLLTEFYKLWIFGGASWRDMLRHRVRFAIKFFFCLLYCFVFIGIWRVVIREGQVALPFSIEDLSWYISLTQIMVFLSPRIFLTIEEDVRSGDVACFLGRPMSYFWMRFAEGFGGMLAQAAVLLTVGFVFLRLYIGAWPSEPWGLVPAVVLMIGGSCLHILFQMATGLTAMWIQDADAIYRIYQKLLIALGGLYMPMAMYPDMVQKISVFMPFSSILYAPASMVFDASVGAFAAALALQIVWGVVAVILAGTVYRFCLKRIEINGG